MWMRVYGRWLVALPLLAGCAQSGRTNDGFGSVRDDVAKRTGRTVFWNKDDEDDRAAEAAVERILERPLTADAAEQVALLNNPALQASFEEIGIAQADLVQAGLLKNPLFSGDVRFPAGGGRPDIQLAVTEDFIQLLTIPLRRKIAQANFTAEQSHVTSEVLDVAAQTRRAFYGVQGARQVLEYRRKFVQAADAADAVAQELHKAGNITELELTERASVSARARLDKSQAEADEAEAELKLSTLMGIWPATAQWKIDGELPSPPANDSPTTEMVARAMRQRPELAAATQEMLAATQAAHLAGPMALLDGTSLGASAERDTDKPWVTGPSISIPIPLLDQGQASGARAAALVRQANRRRQALLVEIRSEVETAGAKLSAARQRVEFYSSTMLPMQKRIVERTQLQYNGMLTGVFQLLAARQGEIEAGRESIEALRAYWEARSELERAVGGMLPGAQAATRPISNE